MILDTAIGPPPAMRRAGAALCIALAAGAAAAAATAPPAAPAAKQVPDELPPETLGQGAIAADRTARVYVSDFAISHITDGRIRVFDARDGKFLGMVSTAMPATSH